ncbi:glycerophosphoryl diester phosphodiesterase [Humitalea rosea]|uniref:Glycerophosphoryl diester phosphodiesterase n=1 Tax=Humitalea rosea TaxID=990373 RepID=A0A2W7KAV5_9PROT|nr:glycerophosphodiester phosphodiesterase family protein [Humitalea rosea]PZW44730.1 glycerophosphoryl diester phosphodiesterase [Humitalea rosea]
MSGAIISHRGGSFLWPENTLLAFSNTYAMPVEQVECDVHLTADGEPVVIHDALADRTTDGRGPVAAMTASEVARLRIRGAGQLGVPSLAAVAALFARGRMLLRVEIKPDATGRPYPEIVPRVLSVLVDAGMLGRSLIIAFDAPTVAAAWRAGGLAGAAWLVEPATLRGLGVAGVAAVALAHGLPAAETGIAAADAAYVAAMRAAGLGCGAWGANHAETIDRALALGLDAFATDDPALALGRRALIGQA